MTPEQARAATPSTPKGPRRRQRGGRFATGDFILETLSQNPKGLRPRDLAAQLSKAAPGAHSSAVSVTNSTLARLRSQGQVRNKGGVWSIAGGAAPKRGRPAKDSRPSASSRGRRARGPGEFAATDFILQSVKDSGNSGVQPKDIVAQIQEKAPGRHTRPSALVSTILTRLKKRGQVRRTRGKWFAAGESEE